MPTAPATPTCRFPLIDPAEQLDPVIRETYGEIERELGFGIVPNIFRSLGTQPAILRSTWHLFRATILQGQLPRIVKELIGTAVSAANRSPYALAVHMHSLGVQGVDQQVIQLVAHDRLNETLLAPSVIALLRIASKAARQGPQSIDAADMQQLCDVDLTQEEIHEAFATIQLFQYVNTLTDLAQVPIDAI